MYYDCSPALNQGHILATNTAENADVLNLHFKSGYTAIESLSHSRICKIKLLDVDDCGKPSSEALAPEMQQYMPVI